MVAKLLVFAITIVGVVLGLQVAVCEGQADDSSPFDATFPRLLWKKEVGGTKSAPATSWPYLYIAVQSCQCPDSLPELELLCLEVTTGEQVWEFQSVHPGVAPMVWGGCVYVGHSDGSLYCLNGQDGKVIWKTDRIGLSTSSPAIADGRLYISTDALYCIDPLDGTVIWKSAVDHATGYANPIVEGGRVYFGDARKFYCVDAVTGQRIWDFDAREEIDYRGTIIGEHVYFANRSGTVFCLNRLTGQKVWETKEEGLGPYVRLGAADGLLYGICRWTTYCFDSATGKRLWKSYSPSTSYMPSMVFGGDYLFITDGTGDMRGEIICRDRKSGRRVWSFFEIDHDLMEAEPIVMDGLLFVCGIGERSIKGFVGTLYCLDLGDRDSTCTRP